MIIKPKNKIGDIVFKKPQLLTTALTHRSALNEKKGARISNERLEFLGDAVLELTVSNYLYQHYPNKNEGQLTHLRSQIVQTKTLAAVAQQLNLGDQLILSKGEKQSGGRKNQHLLANTLEAVIGAIYLDQGLKIASKFIHHYLLKKINQLKKLAQITDYKSILQEKWQAVYKIAPVYKTISSTGPDHRKKFTVKVFLNKKSVGQGTGLSKQTAEQQAAKNALEKKPTF